MHSCSGVSDAVLMTDSSSSSSSSSTSTTADAKEGILLSLLSGGAAGLSVDVVLFPLDTLKTRLQSAGGFMKSGGFRGIYKGLSAAAVGSIPGAALFFGAYDSSKRYFSQNFTSLPIPMIHMTAAAIGETVACFVRVPTEVVKQRMQTGMHDSISATANSIFKAEGPIGLYRGYGATLLREIPFALIQFPLYESLKGQIKTYTGRDVQSYEAAVCGSITGSFAAAVTTPLDVVKTRLMLGKDINGVAYNGFLDTFGRVYAEGKGSPKVLFAGVVPRTFWIGIGGFVFFGAYEKAKKLIRIVI